MDHCTVLVSISLDLSQTPASITKLQIIRYICKSITQYHISFYLLELTASTHRPGRVGLRCLHISTNLVQRGIITTFKANTLPRSLTATLETNIYCKIVKAERSIKFLVNWHQLCRSTKNTTNLPSTSNILLSCRRLWTKRLLLFLNLALQPVHTRPQNTQICYTHPRIRIITSNNVLNHLSSELCRKLKSSCWAQCWQCIYHRWESNYNTLKIYFNRKYLAFILELCRNFLTGN